MTLYGTTTITVDDAVAVAANDNDDDAVESAVAATIVVEKIECPIASEEYFRDKTGSRNRNWIFSIRQKLELIVGLM